MVDLTAIILTFNEEKHIERSIRSVQAIAKRVLVVDSFSTDRTVDIAYSLGAEVVQRKFKNQADQFQWALDHCDVQTVWILRIDADEYLEPGLVSEIQWKIPDLPDEVDGIYVRRKVVFWGRWIRYGGFYPIILLRIWRSGKGYIEQRWMDEHTVLQPGSKTSSFVGHIVDNNLKGITFWVNKHNKYASREMAEVLKAKYASSLNDYDLKNMASSRQARWKRYLKNKIYNKLPPIFRASLYFCYRYFLTLGFLDGQIGFIYHFMQGFWYRLLVDLKVLEVEKIADRDYRKIKEILKTEHEIIL